MRLDGKFTSRMGRIASNPNTPPTGVQATDRIPVPLVLFDASGAVTDTIGWAGRPPPRLWRPPAQDDLRFESVEVDGRRAAVPSPPTALPWWESFLDGYLVVATPLAQNAEDGVFTVTRFGLSEDTIFTRALHYEPTPYSAAVLDSIAARAARGESGGMVPIAMMVGGGRRGPPENWEVIARSLRSAMQFPDYRLPIESVWVAQDEGIWLRRWDGVAATASWIILNSDGNPRGELELPHDVRPMWSRGDVFWAVDPDEFDVPWLVRFTVEPE
jgi:hypothetical protein